MEQKLVRLLVRLLRWSEKGNQRTTKWRRPTTKLKKLTAEQEALVPVVCEHWRKLALGGSRRAQAGEMREHMAWLYRLARFERPIVVVVESVPVALYTAGMLRLVFGQLKDQVGHRVWAMEWEEIEAQVGGQIRDHVRGRVGEDLPSERAWREVWRRVGKQVWNEVRQQSGWRIKCQVGGWAGDWTCNQTRDSPVWKNACGKIWNRASEQIEERLEKELVYQMESEVRTSVEALVWPLTEVAIDRSLTWHVDSSGQMAGLVGESLLLNLADNTGLWGFRQMAGLAAAADYYRKLGFVNCGILDRYLHILEAGMWHALLFRGLAIICSPPKAVHFDRPDEPRIQQRLHRLDGPALQWHDGHKDYFVAGVRVDSDVFESPETLTLQRILDERNVEVRKAFIQIMGLQRFLEQGEASVLDQDTDRVGMPRRLLSLNVGGGQRWCVVEVECPSKRDKHYLWVPPDMERCSQAVAWTFGFEGVEQVLYNPGVEA